MPFLGACYDGFPDHDEIEQDLPSEKQYKAVRTLEGLQKLVEKYDARSVDFFVELFSVRRGGPYPQAAILLYQSKSLQHATPLAPRAIYFNPDLIVAHNGHQAESGSNTVEVIHVDREEGKFDFQEIVFFENENLPPVFSEINPQRCLACHGTPARPIWATYGVWPGVYGGSFLRISEAESTPLRNFLDTLDQLPRYRNLAPADRAYYDKKLEEGDIIHPLDSFSKIISDGMIALIAKDLARDSRVTKFRYALAGAVMGCEFRSLFPDAVWQEHSSVQTIEELIDDTYLLNRERWDSSISEGSVFPFMGSTYEQLKMIPSFPEFDFHYDDTVDDGQTYFGTARYKAPAKLRFILEPIGYSMDPWMTVVADDRYDYHFHFNSNEKDFISAYTEEVEWTPNWRPKTYFEQEELAEKCAELRELSLQSLQ